MGTKHVADLYFCDALLVKRPCRRKCILCWIFDCWERWWRACQGWFLFGHIGKGFKLIDFQNGGSMNTPFVFFWFEVGFQPCAFSIGLLHRVRVSKPKWFSWCVSQVLNNARSLLYRVRISKSNLVSLREDIYMLTWVHGWLLNKATILYPYNCLHGIYSLYRGPHERDWLEWYLDNWKESCSEQFQTVDVADVNVVPSEKLLKPLIGRWARAAWWKQAVKSC